MKFWLLAGSQSIMSIYKLLYDLLNYIKILTEEIKMLFIMIRFVVDLKYSQILIDYGVIEIQKLN